MTARNFKSEVSVETDEGEMLILVEWTETDDRLIDFADARQIAGVDAELPPEWPSLDRPEQWVMRVCRRGIDVEEWTND